VTEYRVLVTGSRDWDNYETIRKSLCQALQTAKRSKKHLVVIHGGATGADTMAGMWAHLVGLPEKDIRVFLARWDKYGRAAGVIRNQQMLDEGKPHMALAFHEDLSKSKGTKDMIGRLRKAGIPHKLYGR
jgi:hypothetical protein